MKAKVHNLACGGGGSLTLERALRRMAGVKEVYVNPHTEIASITYDPTRIDRSQLVAAIARTGYRASFAMEEQ